MVVPQAHRRAVTRLVDQNCPRAESVASARCLGSLLFGQMFSGARTIGPVQKAQCTRHQRLAAAVSARHASSALPSLSHSPLRLAGAGLTGMSVSVPGGSSEYAEERGRLK